MIRLGLALQDTEVGGVFSPHASSGLESIHQQAFTAGAIGMRQEVEELKSGWVREVGIIRMRAEEFRRVGSVLEGQIRREIPETTCSG